MWLRLDQSQVSVTSHWPGTPACVCVSACPALPLQHSVLNTLVQKQSGDFWNVHFRNSNMLHKSVLNSIKICHKFLETQELFWIKMVKSTFHIANIKNFGPVQCVVNQIWRCHQTISFHISFLIKGALKRICTSYRLCQAFADYNIWKAYFICYSFIFNHQNFQLYSKDKTNW